MGFGCLGLGGFSVHEGLFGFVLFFFGLFLCFLFFGWLVDWFVLHFGSLFFSP